MNLIELRKIGIRGVLLLALLVVLTACPKDEPKSSELPASTFKVDNALVPSTPTIPGLDDSAARPVTTLADKDGYKADFVENELIITTKNKAELDAFVTQWQGKLLDSIDLSKIGASDAENVYLVQVNVSSADTNKLAADLKKLEPKARGDYAFGSETGLKLFAATTQERLGDALVTPNWVAQPSAIETGPVTEAPNGMNTKSSEAPGMTYSPNVYNWDYMKLGGPLDTGVTMAWSVLASAGKLGNKIPIAVFDGGIFQNKDLEDAFIYGDWNRPNEFKCGGSPCLYHGTGTAITAFGIADNSYGAAGPAGPIAHRILVQSPSLDVWSILKYVANVAVALGSEHLRVVNISAGFILPAVPAAVVKPVLSAIAIELRLAGILVVAAAGNDNLNLDDQECIDLLIAEICWYKRTSLPCEAQSVLCVGGMQSDKRAKAGFSNFGSGVDIFGPGYVWIPDDNLASNSNKVESGTSVASPFVAGVAGLVLAANPGLSPSDVENILIDTAHTQNADGNVKRAVNAYAAVNRAVANVPPVIRLRANPAQVDLLGNTVLYSKTASSDYQGLFQVFDPNDIYGNTPNSALFVTVKSDRNESITGESYKFETEGTRTLTITARDFDGATSQAFLTINVINTPPEAAQLDDLALSSGQGDELFMSLAGGQPKDKNSPLTCDNVRWSVIGSDSLITEQNSSVGCQAIAVFAEQGTRQVKVTITDPQGLATERNFDVAITEPSAVKSPAVKFIMVDSIKPQAVLQSTTPMNASIAIVNPDNLAVSYKWSWKNDPLGSYPGFTATGVGTSSTLNVVAGVTEIDTGVDGKRFLCRAVDSGGNSIYTNAKLIVDVAFEGISKVQTRDFRFSCVPLQPK